MTSSTTAGLQLTPRQAQLSGSYQLLGNATNQTLALLTPTRCSDAATSVRRVTSRCSIDGDSDLPDSETVVLQPSAATRLAQQSSPVHRSSVSSSASHQTTTKPSVVAGSTTDCHVTASSSNCHVTTSTTSCHVTALNPASYSTVLKTGGAPGPSFNDRLATRTLDDTFNVIDGIRPLEPSPLTSSSKTVSHVKQSRTGLQHRQQQPQQSLSHSASTASCSDSSRVITSSVPTVDCVNSVTDSCYVQTKSVAPVSEQSTVRKGILKGTVTKVKPVVTVGDSSAGDGCSAAVKRSMTFSDLADDAPAADVKAASPVARLTFAEVVRSPPPPTALRRSPLASKENLPPAEIGPEVFNSYVVFGFALWACSHVHNILSNFVVSS